MILTEYQQKILNAEICLYCKSETQIVTEEFIYGKSYRGRKIIACKNFPKCDAYVGCHEDKTAMGRLADKNLREHKIGAHYWFDLLWKEKGFDRSELYAELSDYLKLPGEYTHIGMFSPKTCLKVKEWAKNKYDNIKI